MNESYPKKSTMVRRFLKGCKALFLLGILFTAVTALADMIIPQIVKTTVDHIIGHSPQEMSLFVRKILEKFGGVHYLKQHLWIPALGIVAAALIKVVSQYAFRVCNAMASETFVKTTRDRLFSHIEHLPYAWHMKNHTGDIIQRCTSDIDTMKDFVSEEMTALFRILILLVFSIAFMFGMNPPLAMIAVIPIPLIILNSAIFDRKIEQGFSEFDENEGKLSAMVQENLTGVRVVRAFGRESDERRRFHHQNLHYTRLAERIGKNIGLFWGLSDILTGIQSILVLSFGVWFCIRQKLTAGELIAFLSYNSMLSWPINDLGEIITQLGKTGIAVKRIHYIMNSPAEQDLPDAQKPDLRGDIAFDHVHFAYDNGAEVLHDVSFTMKAGTTLGILGGTGSGKTTLMLLLDKLYSLPENSGTISIGGVDIRLIDTEYLRKNIGVVLQDPYLFSRTIAENIGISDDSLNLDQIRRAAADACLDDTIRGFSKGYDTFVGERGVTLSGGQKQRTAIARVLTRPTPILIFDDSMSAVDTRTDAKIQASLEARFGTASIILISHRITTLSRADQILVLDQGRIAECGTHEELIASNGLYRKIYDIQTDGEEAEQ